MFFEHAVPVVLARKMGCAIPTQTIERRHHLGLNSYDRFFPNQDTMPQGGFGNLIALPQAMRLSTWDKPRIISCAEEFAHHIALPRGCLQEVSELLKAHGVRASVRDERNAGVRIEASFQGTLREEQAAAVRQALRYDEGVLCAPTAFGKTVVASKLIAERGVNTLVLVHRRQLLDQWRERLSLFLNLPPRGIGHVASGKSATTGIVDIALLECPKKG